MSIDVYKVGDTYIWVPVAKPTDNQECRAFLPFAGLSGEYQHGYKAERERSGYFDAVSSVQHAYVNKTTKVFLVQNGTKEENQKKAKWRHGTGSSPPGLGPSLGWVKVPVDDLSKLSSKELGDALRQSNSRYVSIFSSNVMEPIICNTPEKLEAEIDALYQNPAPGIPKGQRKPQRSTGTTEYLSRDARVASYVLRESGGNCECCSSTAPFLKSNGVPYLEVHHVKTLSAGGTDFITNTVAVCPNCHRELHYGANKNNLKSKLYSNVERLIPE